MTTTQPMSPLPHYQKGDIPPAQLWIGNHEDLVHTTMQFLQQQFCQHGGCSTCASCYAIRIQQHHAVAWYYPEKQYTLEQLATISSTLAFALDDGHHYFFIIQKADALTPICSNSLLKSIEEPPPGYHFILLTERPGELLSTIRSRCIVHSWFSQVELRPHANLFMIFSTTASANPAIFLKELESSKINERESVELIDALFQHWLKEGKIALINNDTARYAITSRVVAILKQALLKPPMPGSSNFLWKELFLQIKG